MDPKNPLASGADLQGRQSSCLDQLNNVRPGAGKQVGHFRGRQHFFHFTPSEYSFKLLDTNDKINLKNMQKDLT
jgi:hypothetical protein